MLACPLLLALLALAPTRSAAAQTIPGYETVWRATAPPWIDFVQVEAEAPQLLLTVYARDRALATWTPGQPAAPVGAPLLDRNQRFLRPPIGGILASLRYYYECLDVAFPGVTLRTEVEFLPPVVLPPPPPPPPPPPIEGARQLYLCDDVSLLACVRSGGAHNAPTDVVLLVRDPPTAREWTLSGTYVHPVQGELQLASDGSRIAHAVRGGVILYDRSGVQLGPERPTALGFRLSPSGEVLAIRAPRSVSFTTLDARGRPLGTQTVAVPSLPLDVVFSGDRAVIRARDHLLGVEWRSGAVAWQRTSSGAPYSSVGTATLPGGRLVVAAGMLEVLQPPARLGGRHVDGTALAQVEILDGTSGQPLVPAAAFVTNQWERGSPHVTVLPAARRVLVQTRDLALTSDPLP